MKSALRPVVLYVLPFILILAFLCSFIHGALWYVPDGDDVYFLGVLKAMGLKAGTLFFYRQVTGRWLGHILSFLNFQLFGTHIRYYWIIILLMLFVFQGALAFFLRRITDKYFSFQHSRGTFLTAAMLFTACLYFFVFEGRWETWYWLSSVFIHPFGLTLMFLGFGCILDDKNQKISCYLLMLVSFAALGGIQEICSVLSFFFFFWIWLGNRSAGKDSGLRKIIPAAVVLGLSFLANLFSSGFRTRIDNQPSFHIGQSLKNTVHSVLIPFIDYEFLVPRVLALLIWILWLKMKKEEQTCFSAGHSSLTPLQKISAFSALILGALSMTCYVLCDIAPQRCLLFPAALFLLALSDAMLCCKKAWFSS